MDEEVSQTITEEQRKELRRRLADYRANPDEPLVTLADIPRMRARSNALTSVIGVETSLGAARSLLRTTRDDGSFYCDLP